MALLSARDLGVAFETRDGVVRAVNDVIFSLDTGRVLALLDESGSGKKVTLRARHPWSRRSWMWGPPLRPLGRLYARWAELEGKQA